MLQTNIQVILVPFSLLPLAYSCILKNEVLRHKLVWKEFTINLREIV